MNCGVFLDAPFQFSHQNRNCFRVTLFAIDNSRVDSPIHIGQTSRDEIVLEWSSLSDECQPVPFFDKGLHFRRM